MELKPNAATINNATPAPKLDTHEQTADIRAAAEEKLSGTGLSSEAVNNVMDAAKFITSIDVSDPATKISPEQAREAERTAFEVLSDNEAKRFEKLIDELDPSFDELNKSVTDFNNKAKKLGVDKIIDNDSLSKDEKNAQINKIFDQNPDFRQMRDRVIKSQDRYMHVTKGIHDVFDRFNKNALDKTKYNPKELEKKLQRQPINPIAGICAAIDKLARSIVNGIKSIFMKVERKGDQLFRKQEPANPQHGQHQPRPQAPQKAEPQAPAATRGPSTPSM